MVDYSNPNVLSFLSDSFDINDVVDGDDYDGNSV